MSIVPSESRLQHVGPVFSAASIPWGWRERATTFANDPRAHKLDLGPGLFRADDGIIPEMGAVRAARSMVAVEDTRAYLPPSGLGAFRDEIQKLVLGPHVARSEGAVTIQTIGAANAVRLACDCLVRLGLANEIHVSNESWADHERICRRAGMKVQRYPYLSESGAGVDGERLLEHVEQMPYGSVFLVQPSAHNPTGYDLPAEAWERLFALFESRGIVPLFDAAYIGMGKGIDLDLDPVRACIQRGIDTLVATSCCKTFGLYNERVGALTAALSSAEIAGCFESQIKTDIQASYSTPPREGAAIVAKILSTPSLRSSWINDVECIRRDIAGRRELLVSALSAAGASEGLLRIRSQSGPFAWTGLSKAACSWLASEHALYLSSNGRIPLGQLRKTIIPEVASKLVSAAPKSEHFSHHADAEGILGVLSSRLVPSPARWATDCNVVSYAVRQATSCTYLKVLFPRIVAAAPLHTRERLEKLFSELARCHGRQFDDLARRVEIPEQEGRASYYFDSMYALASVPRDLQLLNARDLASLLAVHAVSYLRGHERYALLKGVSTPANALLKEVWEKFFYDAPRNARLVVHCMFDLFPRECAENVLTDAIFHEARVMASVWNRSLAGPQ